MTEDDGYIPFLTRFKAWWEGVEPHALVRANQPERKAEAKHVVLDADQAAAAAGRRYGPTRLALIQRLWGAECHMPGGAARSLDLFLPTSLKDNAATCDLSAGLGGGTRLMHAKLGLWVDAFEADPELAEQAQEISNRLGLARRVPIRTYDQAMLDFSGKRYDGFLLREVLFQFPSIRTALDAVNAALKDGGHVVFTDFAFATDAKREEPVAREWVEKDPMAAGPFSLKQYKQTLQNLGWETRIFEDDTDQYRKMVLAGWANLLGGIDKTELTRGFVDAMLMEAEIWLLRMKAMDSGALKLLRVHAIKP